ncbi:leucine-rich repeat extensin-like protein 3 isoform X2 [Trichoplusia ni]|uniref:Leucine-rich repeat extensin-like protein 3 isoform X2 n=1 Tax=Trichoplusia ni TaxID=7111 RepID=A0A7E5WWM6_TRINI|nr:leucine-rich repeat extensin-like protein 3 isoform X2 [Trichoplusia ni]
MRLTAIALVLCACVWVAAGDVAHLKAAKTKLIGRLGRGKHHKRGVLSAVPPYKLGYDIPVVTHSLIKPLVVSYPPAAAVTAVKVPLAHPLTTRYPVPVGHKVPVPHPHYGLKFPHHTKTVLLPKPDQHYHHHHHHVEAKPVVPVVPAPVPLPTAAVAHPVPAPSPPVVLQAAPIPPPAPAPLFPAPALPHAHLVPQEHAHLRPLAPAPVPVHPAPVVSPFTQLLPYAHQFPYILRPGNAVQTSYFANYPRYPLLNYQTPLLPLAPPAPAVNQVLFERPQVPHYHFLQQAAGQNGVVFEQPGTHVEPTLLHAHGEIPQHGVHMQPTQPTLHLQPTQPGVHLHPDFHLQPEVHLHPDGHVHPGQQEVHFHSAQPDVLVHPAQPEVHLHSAQPGIIQTTQPGLVPTQTTVHLHPTQPTLEQEGWHPVQAQPHDIAAGQAGGQFGTEGQFAHGAGGNFGQEGHFGHDGQHQFSTEQGTQVYEHHSGEEQYHDFQNQLQHHIQQQLEQAQYEQHINNQQHQPGQEYGVPNIGQDFSHGGQDFSPAGQNFNQPGQNFGPQGNDYDYNQQGQNYDYSQHGQGFGQDFSQQQPSAEYGVPQGAEGRSSAEGEEEQQYHNHIPLKLQPPLERPLEHFR